MKISLCMIVKNEQENIEACLKKARPYVDEIVIVDTGSQDKTKEIASMYTNKVYDFQWSKDFSKARNFSLDKASNNWVIVLDADEFLESFDKKAICKFIKDPKKSDKVGRIRRINILEDIGGKKKYLEYVNRVFNKRYFRYTGTIHEQLTAIQSKDYDTCKLDIIVKHIGYTKQVLNKTNKIKRNIEMLEMALDSDPNDPYLYYQLGKSHLLNKDYYKSTDNFKKALSFDIEFKLEYAVDLVESYGYSLINSNRYKDALELLKWNKVYRNPDFNFLLGLIYMNNAQFKNAVKSFEECTRFSEGKVEGVTTYLPFYNIGVIYEVLGHKKQALHYYNKCGNYKLALDRVASMQEK